MFPSRLTEGLLPRERRKDRETSKTLDMLNGLSGSRDTITKIAELVPNRVNLCTISHGLSVRGKAVVEEG